MSLLRQFRSMLITRSIGLWVNGILLGISSERVCCRGNIIMVCMAELPRGASCLDDEILRLMLCETVHMGLVARNLCARV